MQLRHRVTGLVSALLIAGAGFAVCLDQQERDSVPEYAQILSVEPMMESQTIRTPRYMCVDSTIVIPASLKVASPDNGSYQEARNESVDRVDQIAQSSGQRHCTTVIDVSSREYATSYKVTYRYHGELHTIEIEHAPATSRLPIVDGVAVIKRGADDNDG